MSVLGLARPELLAMSGYASARMEAQGGSIWLNANESPWNPIGEGGINRYPEPQPPALIGALAALYDVDPARILVGRGSDEPIDLLTRAFCRAGLDSVLVTPPTFGMYAVSAQVQGARVVSVPLRAERGFAFDPDEVLAAVDPSVRLVHVCTPNNPTGRSVAPERVLALAGRLRDRAVLVVDEAYVEFAPQRSLVRDAGEPDNLVVLRTLSKAHGLAGVRIGVAIAAPEVIGLLRRIMAPYPLPEPSVDAALRALAPAALARTRQRIELICSERARVQQALRQCDGVLEVLPSDANFLAVRCEQPDASYAQLMAAGIVVRRLGKYPGLANALRITIGAPAENDALLAALAAVRVPA
jgi:histidinol-phosphate aminotransferase